MFDLAREFEVRNAEDVLRSKNFTPWSKATYVQESIDREE
jgi:hypothetical protein